MEFTTINNLKKGNKFVFGNADHTDKANIWVMEQQDKQSKMYLAHRYNCLRDMGYFFGDTCVKANFDINY